MSGDDTTDVGDTLPEDQFPPLSPGGVAVVQAVSRAAKPPRGIEARITWFLVNNPGGVGWCARHSWRSLGGNYGNPPAWGAKNANVVYDKVRKAGRFWTTVPPRGALVLWKYGKDGHAAISAGGGKIYTTDPTNKPGGTGIEKLDYPKKWGAKGYIWTDTYNGVRFDVANTTSGAVPKGKVFLSKLVRGQEDSDSVKRLQQVLNGIKLSGGANLPITGNYFDKTAAEVSKWQKQKANDTSILTGAKLTAAQAKQLFAGTGHTLIDDTYVEPDPEPELPEEPSTESSAGLFKWYSGKPKGEVKVYPDGEWVHLVGLDEPATNKPGGSEKRMLYLRLRFTKTRTADRVVETRFVRANGDETALDSEEFGTTKDSYPYSNVHFEDGDAGGGKWYVRVFGGKDPMTITTRYSKLHTVWATKV